MDYLGKNSTCEDVLKAFSSEDDSVFKAYRGKTIIVTGSNAGIGKRTAQHLAYYGAMVVLACRNKHKAQAAIEWIVQQPAAKNYEDYDSLSSRLKFLRLDLSSLQAIEEFVEEFNKLNWPPLVCLINNAGIFLTETNETAEGFDARFGVNHLGHFLLTKLLLPNLRESAGEVKSRVITVSSMIHAKLVHTEKISTKEDLMDILVKPKNKPKGFWNAGMIYSNSKVSNILFTQSLNEKESKNGVIAVALHPGFVASDLGYNYSTILGWVVKYIGPWFLKTPDQGASCTLTSVFAPEELVAGKYLYDCQLEKTGKLTLGDIGKKNREVLWSLSEELVSDYL
eukprot:augustus_masked-scaffold_13-processed-gene-11.76-mRNA-1 protein AED:0.26 eAED:0.26 QI:0/-1/0/1/-1/1/1/0/338